MIPCLAIVVSASNPAFLAGLAMTASAGCVIRGFQLLARKRSFACAPICKISRAPAGLVEVSGFAVGGHTLEAPITGRACYLYRTIAWERRGSGGGSDWHKVAEESMQLPFFLDDHTGQVLVKPDGIELELHHEYREEFEGEQFANDGVPASVLEFLQRQGVAGSGSVRVEECCIRPKDFLMAVGTLTDNSNLHVPDAACGEEDGAHEPGRNGREISAERAHVIRLSGTAGADGAQSTQQSKIAAALLKAGIESPIRGDSGPQPLVVPTPQAPQVSEVLVKQAHPADGAASGAADDTVPGEGLPLNDLSRSVVLLKGPGHTPFLVSWRSQSKIARALARKAYVMISGGTVLALLGAYLVLTHAKLP